MNLNSKVKFGLSFCPLEPMWKGDHGGILSLITITPEKKNTHTHNHESSNGSHGKWSNHLKCFGNDEEAVFIWSLDRRMLNSSYYEESQVESQSDRGKAGCVEFGASTKSNARKSKGTHYKITLKIGWLRNHFKSIKSGFSSQQVVQ